MDSAIYVKCRHCRHYRHKPYFVSVISGKSNTVIGNPIAVGSNRSGITFDFLNGNLYITNPPDKVYVISTVSPPPPPPPGDTTPPSITVPNSIAAEATDPSCATVSYQVTATDNVHYTYMQSTIRFCISDRNYYSYVYRN